MFAATPAFCGACRAYTVGYTFAGPCCHWHPLAPPHVHTVNILQTRLAPLRPPSSRRKSLAAGPSRPHSRTTCHDNAYAACPYMFTTHPASACLIQGRKTHNPAHTHVPGPQTYWRMACNLAKYALISWVGKGMKPGEKERAARAYWSSAARAAVQRSAPRAAAPPVRLPAALAAIPAACTHQAPIHNVLGPTVSVAHQPAF